MQLEAAVLQISTPNSNDGLMFYFKFREFSNSVPIQFKLLLTRNTNRYYSPCISVVHFDCQTCGTKKSDGSIDCQSRLTLTHLSKPNFKSSPFSMIAGYLCNSFYPMVVLMITRFTFRIIFMNFVFLNGYQGFCPVF